MIIDSHLHLWVQNPEKYPWGPIGDYVPATDASLQCFLQIQEKNNIDRCVFVQPTPYGWDNSYLLACKQSDPENYRAVVLVDPLSENASLNLQTLQKDGADGLRINLHLQPLAKWQTQAFHQLLKTTVNLNLPICLQLTPVYLDFVRELAQTYPLTIVLDHLGRPNSGCSQEDEDFLRLLKLADLPNVHIKLSGLNYYSQENAPYRDTWSLLRTVVSHFGADHCMWGSDFPFVEDHWSYPECIETFQNELGLSENSLDWIFAKTANAVWWGEG